ncbi:DedA family protein [Croceibacterium sp. LX-88]|jgi:membrane protein DedA with SNARE-associated domain|uniref:DedA family protein n=1 Tax=Croceibacterium selenioxidans TaxID=2838833 RepID=A0ABS5W2J5_9SPHN|nr:DedA family protein [Croceibacterium selenioxidans]MBT2133711.1 DedA family protein [Croceibacterium selenioxidans]
MHEFIIDAIALGGYWGIAFLMAIENVFPPIPSEVIMGIGGLLVGRGEMEFWPLLIAGTVGSTAGNYVWFWMGDKWGYRRLAPLIERHGRWLTLEWEDIENATRFFQRHGQWVVLVLRFSPFLRTMISLPAGLSHMKAWKFLLFTFIGAGIWNVLLIYGGQWLGRYFEQSQDVLAWIVLGAFGLAIVAYLWRVVTWKPRAER